MPGHEGARDELRTAWLATIAAADRAGAALHGAGPPGRRLPWQDAVTECWRALALVHAGIGEARASSGVAADLLAGLRSARADADRAAALAARTRWWLAASDDSLRRRAGRSGTRQPVGAALRFAAAARRLDLVATRLAVGASDRQMGGRARRPGRTDPRLTVHPGRRRRPHRPGCRDRVTGHPWRHAAHRAQSRTGMTTFALRSLLDGRLGSHERRCRGGGGGRRPGHQ
ncbi:hypothetical protein D0Q02_06725 [Micromonospora craniellae]|uniref:Uncharacterized protein n=1 Tax=Micromonospora craniellae TaxID=2294034 RepID=A0A372G2M5_9ACTN|nr:hypothetical protein D0Q02_06725 [Micromonospora craniellae]